ncbi:hypothetical protein BV898_17754 [Hypsibius exemplaris]|uniref:WW domain-containing protein n=1 Tax=Hypsibius exemplaris TaxID=2072580 RepID=A0A9X6NPB1_HYPEX|nr:hypothetical protein BV898_17754 [Hypsibius exemplaris]
MEEETGVTIITRQQGPSIIHERSDSKNLLNDLFNVQNQQSDKPTLRNRNLPSNFFIPPNGAGTTKEFNGTANAGPYVHVRVRSAPASIDQTLSLPPEVPTNLPPSSTYQTVTASVNHQQQQQQQHFQQAHNRHKSVPAPHPINPQIYNTVNINQHYELGYLQDSRIVFRNRTTNAHYPDSPTIRDQILGALPAQWHRNVDDRGEVYYVDEGTKTTSWFDPRLPREIQEPFVHSRHQQNQSNQSQQQQQQLLNGPRALPAQQRPAGSSSMGHSSQPSMMQQLMQQSLQPTNFVQSQGGGYSGGVHHGRSLSIPAVMSQPLSPAPVQQQTVRLPQQQQTRLHELEMERENMRQRQKEIQKLQLFNQQPAFPTSDPNVQMGMQEHMMRRQMGDEYLGSPISPLASLRSTDPFLYHGRQESGDSGCFSASHPHTPENFLSQNMEELSLYAGTRDDWQQGGSSMDVTVAPSDSMTGAHQQDQIMSDEPDLSDIYFSDLESVLRNDKPDPYANVTWL